MTVQIKKIEKRTKFILASFLLSGLILFSGRRVIASQVWTERTVVDSFSPTLRALASSANGQDLAVADNANAKLYISNNYGTTWTQKGLTDRWVSIAMSGDGQEIAAVNASGYMELTTNGGTNWSTPCVNSCHFTGVWTSITMSADGQHLAVTNIGGYEIWISNNFGTTWTLSTAEADVWQSIAYSPDGNTLIAASNQDAGGTGYITISTNHGTDWTRITNNRGNWASIVAANGGKVAVVGGYLSSDLFTSANNGGAWHDTGFGGGLDFNNNTLASSADGSILIAASSGEIDISTNGGNTWTPQSEPDPGSGDWEAVATSSDGSKIAVAGYPTFWTYNANAPTLTEVTPIPEKVALKKAIYHFTASEECVDFQATEIQGGSGSEEFIIDPPAPDTDLTASFHGLKAGKTYSVSFTCVDADSFPSNTLDIGPFKVNSSSGGTGGHVVHSTPNTTELVPETNMPPVPVARITDIQSVIQNLKLGMKGVDVKTLQEFLTSQNKTPAAQILKDHGTTDFFGKLTKAALAEWQTASGLVGDGIFGPKTRAKILELGL